MGQDDEYVLGTDDDELARLGYQAQLWRAQAYSIWERARFTRGMRLLDVGAGPGFTTLDLAGLTTSAGHVTGVDLSQRFLDHLTARARARGVQHVSVIQGALETVELPHAAFDGAYARWVLCFVRDPEAVVARIAAALRPGARWAIQDYIQWSTIRLMPRRPIFERVCEAVEHSWRKAGGDAEILTRLPEVLARHGMRVESFVPLVKMASPSDQLWQWPVIFFRNYVPVLVRLGLVTADEQAEFEREWARLCADPSGWFVTPLLGDMIAVKR